MADVGDEVVVVVVVGELSAKHVIAAEIFRMRSVFVTREKG